MQNVQRPHMVAGMSVIVRADGVSEALYNGQRDRVVEAVKAEMARQKNAMMTEMDCQKKAFEAEMRQIRREADKDRKQLESRLEGECDRAEMVRSKRNRFAGRMLAALDYRLNHKYGLAWRVKERIARAWAILYSLTAGKLWIEGGETLGLWERIDSGKEERHGKLR